MAFYIHGAGEPCQKVNLKYLTLKEKPPLCFIFNNSSGGGGSSLGGGRSTVP